jgi:hypothetical protein
MKEFDPDSRIFLKVFPDMVNPNFFEAILNIVELEQMKLLCPVYMVEQTQMYTTSNGENTLLHVTEIVLNAMDPCAPLPPSCSC